MIVTKFEEFISEDLTHDEIAGDCNNLYRVINKYAKVRSSDYRCYVTPQRELVILFLVDGIDIDADNLKNTIFDKTVLRAYDINSIEVILDKNTFDAELVASSKEEGVVNLEDINFKDINFKFYYSQVAPKLMQYPKYERMIDSPFQF